MFGSVAQMDKLLHVEVFESIMSLRQLKNRKTLNRLPPPTVRLEVGSEFLYAYGRYSFCPSLVRTSCYALRSHCLCNMTG